MGVQIEPTALARRVGARIDQLARYGGTSRRCPNCGARLRGFEPCSRFGLRCPRCGARDRHRLLALYLLDVSEIARGRPRILHFAPEGAIQRVLHTLAPRSYVSADLDAGRAQVQADIVDLPFDGGSFELILCSHVLEHVADDRLALAEIARVLAPDGEALIQTPVDPRLELTIENPDLGPDERRRAFGQDDHVRVYGTDLRDRITEAGLRCRAFTPAELPARRRSEAALKPAAGGPRNEIFVCSRAHRSP